MIKKTFLFLTLALAFALAPSLEAQIEISWRGHTLVGDSYRNRAININNLRPDKGKQPI